MKRMMLRVAGLMVLFGALSVATAHADTRFSIHVGVGAPVAPPVVVAPRRYAYGYAAPVPYPGYVWQPGYYVGYRWVPGAWVPRGHRNYRKSRHEHRYDDRGWNGDRRYR